MKLLCLEEYVIVYRTHRDLKGERLDISTWCWLRTRYGLGALRAGAFAGEVLVGRIAAGDLSVPLGSVGGRAVEVIKNAT